MKKILLIICLVIGCGMVVAGIGYWANDGFAIDGLYFYTKTTFSRHPLHLSLLGLLLIAYVVFEHLFRSSTK